MGFLVDFIRSQGISLGATSGTSMISWDFTCRNQCFKGFRLLNGFQGIKGFSIDFEGFQGSSVNFIQFHGSLRHFNWRYAQVSTFQGFNLFE